MAQEQSEKEKLLKCLAEHLGFEDVGNGFYGRMVEGLTDFVLQDRQQAIDQAVAEARVGKTVTITELTPHDKNELYCTWYTCPNCRKPYIAENSNFCPDCGGKIDWQLYEQEKSA